MSARRFTAQDDIRTWLYRAMSGMYRSEVPLYGDLLSIVHDVNARACADDPELEQALRRRGEFERLSDERHGAIRLGTAEELAMMRRVFAVMGMEPVGYYDLVAAGVPVHATAFRPTELASLNRNPFRVFTSLLRLDLIDDRELRDETARLLGERRIFTERAVALVEQFERDGGLEDQDAHAFVAEVLETFRWHRDTAVDPATYDRLHTVHRLVADVACFRGPHINHLTPRTLDIDAAQAEMLRRGIDAKEVIEGPPRRVVPILLRQTSFKALEEKILFLGADGGRPGVHTARFGEIEQRGLALTPVGRSLYDELLAAAGPPGAEDYESRRRSSFDRFPDDLDVLRRERLGYFHYRLVGSPVATDDVEDVEALVRQGVVEAAPVVYEDFLPVSAAGVFQSNLGPAERHSYDASAARSEFEAALGVSVADPFALYQKIEDDSLAAVRAALSPSTATADVAVRARPVTVGLSPSEENDHG